MRTIVAIDPGKTTGWAIRHASGHREAGQIEGAVMAMAWVWSVFNSAHGSSPVLVVENFVPRGGALTTQPDALHIIGFIKGMCHIYGWGFILQSPAEAKSFSTNEKLKRAGWWVVGQDHARDALRHLMRHLCVTEHDTELLRAVAP